MSSVILKGFILVPDAELEIVLTELINHKKLTLAESGCLVFEVTQSVTDPCRFEVYEEFEDQVSFTAHQARVKASHWGQVTVNVERYYELLES